MKKLPVAAVCDRRCPPSRAGSYHHQAFWETEALAREPDDRQRWFPTQRSSARKPQALPDFTVLEQQLVKLAPGDFHFTRQLLDRLGP